MVWAEPSQPWRRFGASSKQPKRQAVLTGRAILNATRRLISGVEREPSPTGSNPLALLGGAVCALYAALFLRRISTPTLRARRARVVGSGMVNQRRSLCGHRPC